MLQKKEGRRKRGKESKKLGARSKSSRRIRGRARKRKQKHKPPKNS